LVAIWPEDEFRLTRQFRSGPLTRAIDTKHDFAARRPARPSLPTLCGMQVRHPQLDRPCPIHLLAANLSELTHHALSERHIRVKPGTELAHEPRADEQLVRRDFGIRRAFLESGNEKLGPKLHGEAAQASGPP